MTFSSSLHINKTNGTLGPAMSCQTTDRRPRDALNLDCLSILRWKSIGYAGHQQEVAGDIERSEESKARHEFLDETVKTRTSSRFGSIKLSDAKQNVLDVFVIDLQIIKLCRKRGRNIEIAVR